LSARLVSDTALVPTYLGELYVLLTLRARVIGEDFRLQTAGVLMAAMTQWSSLTRRLAVHCAETLNLTLLSSRSDQTSYLRARTLTTLGAAGLLHLADLLPQLALTSALCTETEGEGPASVMAWLSALAVLARSARQVCSVSQIATGVKTLTIDRRHHD
jgi:hypothetical protein